MAYCSKCGHKLEEGDKFCPKCGHKVEDESREVGQEEEKETEFPESLPFE